MPRHKPTSHKSIAHTKQAPAKSNTPYFLIGGAVLVVIIVIVAILVSTQSPPPATATRSLPAEISVSDAKEMRDSGAFLLDVREPSEWEAVHIPGATLIPLGQLQSRLNELPRDQEIVVVCRSGNRSVEGRNILLSAGFEQVTSMAGGMNDWVRNGFPTATGP